MNHCPVYQNIGGHSYGWVYPGPIGSVLTPSYIGLENALDLPQASTLCNQCGVVCPVKIPLPDLSAQTPRAAIRAQPSPVVRARRIAWLGVARDAPAALRAGDPDGRARTSLARRRQGMIHKLPPGGGWTDGRDMPAPAGRTFRDLYAKDGADHEFIPRNDGAAHQPPRA